jgi:23S rRNA (adenine1618-N6)-methyltransferase
VSLFGWRFVATDAQEASVRWAERLVRENPSLAGRVECRWQADTRKIFEGVVSAGERFSVSVCNPPFHTSAEEADAGTRRKLRNLGAVAGRRAADGRPVLNFGGRGNELWCEGGEAGFVRRMIRESAARPGLCGWFTTLVSKSGRLPELEAELARVGAVDVRVLGMRHGEKISRVLAWRFETK